MLAFKSRRDLGIALGASLLALVSGCSRQSFVEMHREAVARQNAGASAEAAGRKFLGRNIEMDATFREDLRDQFVLMDTGGVTFVAAPDPDLDTVRFLLLAYRNRGRSAHITGKIGGTQDFPGKSPLVVSIESVRLADSGQP